MIISKDASLLGFNTFGIDVKTSLFVEYNTVDELKAVLTSEMVSGKRMLHVGSGSNLLFLSDFDGVILHSGMRTINLIEETDEHVFIEAGSGVVWDDFVAYTVENGWGGAENLSLIPGEVGASAVQNIGAYGVEVKDLIAKVKTIEISTSSERIFSNDECRYGYRQSIFKQEFKGKYIVTSVIYKLDKDPVYQLGYQHLEDEVRKNGDVSLKNIRETIIAVRESKLPDPKILGNAGSFFMNPVVPKQQFLELQSEYPTIPHYFVSESEEKIPAAWFIDQCNWKGKQLGHVGVHDKQPLVLVNKGGATGQEVVHLAEEIQKSVKKRFGIELYPEVNYI
ncbi:MAG: UDP-N-acetylmuramate dehydrogenase [Paludibacter sp.]|nr:UDP-N-acetylmuramate dehydrogenase [Paludibacter sp.]